MAKKNMKEIRSKSDEELHKWVNELDILIAKFRAASSIGGGGAIDVPAGSHGVNWGAYHNAKKMKARILSVLNERINQRLGKKKPRREARR